MDHDDFDADDDTAEALFTEGEFEAALAQVRDAAFRKGRDAQRAETVRVARCFAALNGDGAKFLTAVEALTDPDPLAKAFDESLHPRDHGKFSEKPGAKGEGGKGKPEPGPKGAAEAAGRPKLSDEQVEALRAIAELFPGGIGHLLGDDGKVHPDHLETEDERAANAAAEAHRARAGAARAEWGRVNQEVESKRAEAAKIEGIQKADADLNDSITEALFAPRDGVRAFDAVRDGDAFRDNEDESQDAPDIADSLDAIGEALQAMEDGDPLDHDGVTDVGDYAVDLDEEIAKYELDADDHEAVADAHESEVEERRGHLADVTAALAAEREAARAESKRFRTEQYSYAKDVAAACAEALEIPESDWEAAGAGHELAQVRQLAAAVRAIQKELGGGATKKKALAADADDDADDTDLHTPTDDDLARELLLHAAEHARDCAHDGRDCQPVLDALAGLASDPHELRRVLEGDTVEKAFNKDEKRDEKGRWSGSDSSRIRFEAGKKLTPAEREEVVKSVKDVYRENGLQKSELKGHHKHSGDPIYGYPHAPEHFVTSDITGAKVRHYVTLPDGRKAHPSELFPEITQSDIDRQHFVQEAEAKLRSSRDDARAARVGPTKSDANANYTATNRKLVGSYLAKNAEGQFARVDATDPDDVEYYHSQGFDAVTEVLGPDGTTTPAPIRLQKAVQWSEDKHPRDDAGRWVSKDAIHRAKHDPKLAKQLRKRVTDPDERKKLEDALSSKTEIGHTAASKRRADAAAKREKVTADRDQARAIRDRLFAQHQAGGDLHADDLRALIPHLSTMSHAELTNLRIFLGGAGASFGGATRLAERRARVLDWANAKAEEKPPFPALPYPDIPEPTGEGIPAADVFGPLLAEASNGTAGRDGDYPANRVVDNDRAGIAQVDAAAAGHSRGGLGRGGGGVADNDGGVSAAEVSPDAGAKDEPKAAKAPVWKDRLDRALSPDDSPDDSPLAQQERVAAAYRFAQRHGNADAVAGIERDYVERHGLARLHAPGEVVRFDGRVHEAETGVSDDQPVRVVHSGLVRPGDPGQAVHRALVVPATSAPAEPKAAALAGRPGDLLGAATDDARPLDARLTALADLDTATLDHAQRVGDIGGNEYGRQLEQAHQLLQTRKPLPENPTKLELANDRRLTEQVKLRASAAVARMREHLLPGLRKLHADGTPVPTDEGHPLGAHLGALAAAYEHALPKLAAELKTAADAPAPVAKPAESAPDDGGGLTLDFGDEPPAAEKPRKGTPATRPARAGRAWGAGNESAPSESEFAAASGKGESGKDSPSGKDKRSTDSASTALDKGKGGGDNTPVPPTGGGSTGEGKKMGFTRPAAKERRNDKGDTFVPVGDPASVKGGFVSGRDKLYPAAIGDSGRAAPESDTMQTYLSHGTIAVKDGVPRVYAAAAQNGRPDVFFASAQSHDDFAAAVNTLRAAGLDPAEHLPHAAAHTFGTGTRSMLSRVHEYLRDGGVEPPAPAAPTPSDRESLAAAAERDPVAKLAFADATREAGDDKAADAISAEAEFEAHKPVLQAAKDRLARAKVAIPSAFQVEMGATISPEARAELSAAQAEHDAAAARHNEFVRALSAARVAARPVAPAKPKTSSPAPVALRGNTFAVRAELGKIPGAKYNERTKRWTVPAEHAERAQKLVDGAPPSDPDWWKNLSHAELAERGFIRTSGPRGPYIRRGTPEELNDYL